MTPPKRHITFLAAFSLKLPHKWAQITPLSTSPLFACMYISGIFHCILFVYIYLH
jgi:hypothetical protein